MLCARPKIRRRQEPAHIFSSTTCPTSLPPRRAHAFEQDKIMPVSEAVFDPAVKVPLVARPDLFDAKPSLIGLTREKRAEALKDKGVPKKQAGMRVSQLGHGLYTRGVS